jgi:hypothetical protein
LLYGLRMRRVLFLGFVLAATACGNKTFPSLCATQVPPPAECMTACNPTPGAADNCPGGFHCSPDGKCDTVCTAAGGQCGNDYSCTSDGRCVPNGNGSGGGDMADACPSVHVTAKSVIPTVELLLDQSGSMADAYGSSPHRWTAMVDALVNPTTGVVKQLQGKVAFGATLFTSESVNNVAKPGCPFLKHAVTAGDPRVLNNFTAIQTLLNGNTWDQDTPTPESINAVVADFKAHPPSIAGSPPIIVLATDGLPDTCADPNPANQTDQNSVNAMTVKAAQDAFKAGIKIFYLFIGNDQAGTHPQQMANAGAGLDPATGNAKFYVATDPAGLATAFNQIVGGVLSCDLTLDGQVSTDAAPNGTVTLNNVVLNFGTDWNIDADGKTLHILGKACDTLKSTPNATVDATFACGAIIF